MKNKDSTLIMLDTVINFSWDTLYVFHGIETRENLKSSYNIQVNTEGIGDDCTLYAFFKGKTSVYEETNCYDPNECSVTFPFAEGLSKYTSYRVFKITNKNIYDGKGVHYNFYPRK